MAALATTLRRESPDRRTPYSSIFIKNRLIYKFQEGLQWDRLKKKYVFTIWALAYAPEGFMQIKRDAAPDAASTKQLVLKSVKKARLWLEKEHKGNGMKTVRGKYNEAIVYTDVVEDMALQQLKQLCDMEFAADARIRIMPDVHAGAGST